MHSLHQGFQIVQDTHKTRINIVKNIVETGRFCGTLKIWNKVGYLKFALHFKSQLFDIADLCEKITTLGHSLKFQNEDIFRISKS